MHMSFAGGNNSKSSQFDWDDFKLQVLYGNKQEAIEILRKFKFSDVLFFRVVPENSHLSFLEGTVNGHHFNILQFAVGQG